MTREEIERGVRAVAAIFTRHGVQGPDHDPSPIHLARQWCFGLANEEPRGLITAELYDGVSGRLLAMGCSGERAARQAMVIALEAIAAWDVAVEMTDEAARCFAELIEAGVVPRAAREQALHGEREGRRMEDHESEQRPTPLEAALIGAAEADVIVTEHATEVRPRSNLERVTVEAVRRAGARGDVVQGEDLAEVAREVRHG